MLQLRRVGEIALLLLATLLVLMAAAAALPARLPAQQTVAAAADLATNPANRATFEGYVSRVRTDPAVAGERVHLAGMGARLLVPLADRLALGGFVTYAPDADRGITAWHYGAQTDVRLLDRPVAGVVEPLVSLGVGAFRAQRGPGLATPYLATDCWLRRTDLALLVGSPVSPCSGGGERALGTHLALSPALAARVWLLPDVALRADAREVIVYDGAPRHVFELTTGLSFSR